MEKWQHTNEEPSSVRLRTPSLPCRSRSCRTCASLLNSRWTTKNVVYEITCRTGVHKYRYLGETKRCIRYRFDEHFRDATNRSQQTPLGDHMIKCHPSESVPQLSVAIKAILRHCEDGADRKIAEALTISPWPPGGLITPPQFFGIVTKWLKNTDMTTTLWRFGWRDLSPYSLARLGRVTDSNGHASHLCGGGGIIVCAPLCARGLRFWIPRRRRVSAFGEPVAPRFVEHLFGLLSAVVNTRN